MKHTPATFPDVVLLKDQIAGAILVSFLILHVKANSRVNEDCFFLMAEIKDVGARRSALSLLHLTVVDVVEDLIAKKRLPDVVSSRLGCFSPTGLNKRGCRVGDAISQHLQPGSTRV